jgi:hypothetical protein
MTLQTTIHYYRFDMSKPQDPAAYDALCETLRATPGRGRWMHCIGDTKDRLENRQGGSEPITLETSFVFSNQWNETDGADRKGRRVFDWFEAIYQNRSLRCGHYLEITPQMIAIRESQHVCGYCGARSDRPVETFCSACLDSPYLKAAELHLLRLAPIVDSDKPRAPLTDDERAALMPRYITRQTTGADSRAAQKRAKARIDTLHDCELAVSAAVTKRDGYIWLLDHNVSIENVIYYRHTGRFAFGWREPLSPEVRSRLTDLLCEFPFDYDFAEPRK